MGRRLHSAIRLVMWGRPRRSWDKSPGHHAYSPDLQLHQDLVVSTHCNSGGSEPLIPTPGAPWSVVGSERGQWNTERQRGGEEAVIIARKLDRLAAP